MKHLIFLVLFLPSTTLAAKAPYTQSEKSTAAEAFSGVALNAAAATRTLTISLGKLYSKLRLRVDYTYSAATSVTLTPTCSMDGTNYSSYTTRSCASGACTVYPMTDVDSTGADFDYIYEYDVRGCEKFKVVFSGGGSPDASDLISTQGTVVVGY